MQYLKEIEDKLYELLMMIQVITLWFGQAVEIVRLS